MNTSPQNPSDDRKLTIIRDFAAPRELVFTTWTEKRHLDHWCAPAGFTIPFSEGEFKTGGQWRSTMVSPDGAEYRLEGKYLEVIPKEKIVFTHAWIEDSGLPGTETIVTVNLSDHEGKTRMIFEQAIFDSAGSRDSHRGGWMQCFDRLDVYMHEI